MPVYCTETTNDGCTLAIWELQEGEALPAAQDVLPAAVATAHAQRRRERLAVHLLLQHLFGENVQLDYHANGQPFLPGRKGCLSISHTKRFVAVIYHPERRVGIDVEDTTRNFAAVAQKVLTAAERDYLSDNHRALQLCLIWCAKEALYKCIPNSSADFRRMEIAAFTPQREGVLTARCTAADNETCACRLRYRLLDNHALVWVVA